MNSYKRKLKQMGGQNQPSELAQNISAYLQQGASPEELVYQLLSSQVPEEEIQSAFSELGYLPEDVQTIMGNVMQYLGQQQKPQMQYGSETPIYARTPRTFNPDVYATTPQDNTSTNIVTRPNLITAGPESNYTVPQYQQPQKPQIQDQQGIVDNTYVDPLYLLQLSPPEESTEGLLGQTYLSEYNAPSAGRSMRSYLANPLTTFGYLSRGERLPDIVPSKGNPYDMAMDIVNPFAFADYALSAGESLGRGDYLGAFFNALGAIPTVPISASTAKKFLPASVTTLPQSKSFREALGTLSGIPAERSLARLTPAELKIYRQAQELGRMEATGKSLAERFKYALDQNIPDEHLQRIFGQTKSEIEEILPSLIEQDALRAANPYRSSINLQRPPRNTNRNQSIRDAIDDLSGNPINDFSDFDDIVVNSASDMSRMATPEETALAERFLQLEDVPITNTPSWFPLQELEVNPRANWRRDGIIFGDNLSYVRPRAPKQPISQSFREFNRNLDNRFLNLISEYPAYYGVVKENVPSLSLRGAEGIKDISKKVNTQGTRGVTSGDVFTGSLNTSHSSYLPQIKQVFKYSDGAPQFLGYRPMNQMGFLSNYEYPLDDIAKYLNTEIDQQIARGVIPKNIQRPYVTPQGYINLPHYGIKQFQPGGEYFQQPFNRPQISGNPSLTKKLIFNPFEVTTSIPDYTAPMSLNKMDLINNPDMFKDNIFDRMTPQSVKDILNPPLSPESQYVGSDWTDNEPSFGQKALNTYSKLSTAAVNTAGILNELFRKGDRLKREESLYDITRADDWFPAFENPVGKKGTYDINTGLLQQDAYVPYMRTAQRGREMPVADRFTYMPWVQEYNQRAEAFNEEERRKAGITQELKLRQAAKESSLRSDAESDAQAKGLTQIRPSLEDYYKQKTGLTIDPFNIQDAMTVQDWYMNNLYNREWIDKPNQADSVRTAKTLAAYNWGPDALMKYLTRQKASGVDIYNSWDWLQGLPEETSDYINKVYRGNVPEFEQDFQMAVSRNPDIARLYRGSRQMGGELEVDSNTLAALIAAGADIEML